MDLWITILSSSVVSGATAAIVAGWFALRSKRSEYENAYFKQVLDKRISAYAEVEALISEASIATVDADNRTYHAMFIPREKGVQNFYVHLYKAMYGKFWLSSDLYAAVRQLNILAYPAGDNQEVLLNLAKERYEEIAEARTKIEWLHTRDMLTLHRVPQFLKTKKFGNEFQELPPRIG